MLDYRQYRSVRKIDIVLFASLLISFFLFGCGDGSLAPVADAGPDQTVEPMEIVTLDGSGSFDGDGDSLEYSWSFISIPQNSIAVIVSPNSETTTFVAEVEGVYNVLLIVDDGEWDDSDSVKITCYNSAS